MKTKIKKKKKSNSPVLCHPSHPSIIFCRFLTAPARCKWSRVYKRKRKFNLIKTKMRTEVELSKPFEHPFIRPLTYPWISNRSRIFFLSNLTFSSCKKLIWFFPRYSETKNEFPVRIKQSNRSNDHIHFGNFFFSGEEWLKCKPFGLIFKTRNLEEVKKKFSDILCIFFFFGFREIKKSIKSQQGYMGW